MQDENKTPVSEPQEVVGQYIQLPRIAKDFANYYDLYLKYQSDYDVEAILSRCLPPPYTIRPSRRKSTAARGCGYSWR